MTCPRCKAEKADRGFSVGPRCDLAEINAVRARQRVSPLGDRLAPLTPELYDRMFPPLPPDKDPLARIP